MKHIMKVGAAALMALMLVISPIAASVASAAEYDFSISGKIGPAATSAVTPTPTPAPSTDSSSTSPQTGDDANIMVYAVTALLSMVMLVLLWRKREDQYESTAFQGS